MGNKATGATEDELNASIKMTLPDWALLSYTNITPIGTFPSCPFYFQDSKDNSKLEVYDSKLCIQIFMALLFKRVKRENKYKMLSRLSG